MGRDSEMKVLAVLALCVAVATAIETEVVSPLDDHATLGESAGVQYGGEDTAAAAAAQAEDASNAAKDQASKANAELAAAEKRKDDQTNAANVAQNAESQAEAQVKMIGSEAKDAQA